MGMERLGVKLEKLTLTTEARSAVDKIMFGGEWIIRPHHLNNLSESMQLEELGIIDPMVSYFAENAIDMSEKYLAELMDRGREGLGTFIDGLRAFWYLYKYLPETHGVEISAEEDLVCLSCHAKPDKRHCREVNYEGEFAYLNKYCELSVGKVERKGPYRLVTNAGTLRRITDPDIWSKKFI